MTRIRVDQNFDANCVFRSQMILVGKPKWHNNGGDISVRFLPPTCRAARDKTDNLREHVNNASFGSSASYSSLSLGSSSELSHVHHSYTLVRFPAPTPWRVGMRRDDGDDVRISVDSTYC
jgi:hypothetical protein